MQRGEELAALLAWRHPSTHPSDVGLIAGWPWLSRKHATCLLQGVVDIGICFEDQDGKAWQFDASPRRLLLAAGGLILQGTLQVLDTAGQGLPQCQGSCHKLRRANGITGCGHQRHPALAELCWHSGHLSWEESSPPLETMHAA